MNEEPQNKNQKEDSYIKASLQNLKAFWENFRDFLGERLSIRDNARPQETIQGIDRDIEFKGFNLWILFFSIIVCSVGLNVNSTAVVIGAMLISPLMGPIMGMGLSIGTNDWPMMRRSIKSLATATVVAISASTIYFLLTPLSDASAELLARTRPTLLDVFVAFFGGLAGILAGSRKEKNNVIPGVAIATALMPPLCTAGYGLATMQFSYFFGAFYLYLINTFFIGVATTLVVRYLKFPEKKLVDGSLEKKARRYVLTTAIIVMIPSTFIFWGVVQETIFNRRANLYISEVIHYQGTEIIKNRIVEEEGEKTISLVIMGKEIPQEVIAEWKRKLPAYQLEKVNLRVLQGVDGTSKDDIDRMVTLFSESQREMFVKEQSIRQLESEVNRYKTKDIPRSLFQEINIQQPDIRRIQLGRMLSTNFEEQTDTIIRAVITWNKAYEDPESLKSAEKLKKWLSVRLNDSKVEVENRFSLEKEKVEKAGPQPAVKNTNSSD